MKKIVKKIKVKEIVRKTQHYSKGPFWFLTGFIVTGVTIASVFAVIFQNLYKDRVIPGVYVDDIEVSEKSEDEVKNIFEEKNNLIQNSTFNLTYEDKIATISARDLNIGYNTELISMQAISVGKSKDIFTNFFNILNSYLYGTTLKSSFTFNDDELLKLLKPIEDDVYIAPIDAQFQVDNDRVSAFKESVNGRKLDVENVRNFIESKSIELAEGGKQQVFVYELKSIVLKPEITTEEANEFGIVEPIGEGLSYFPHSIPSRIFNINLASQRVNGILVKPGEEFSFVKYLGDVSKLTGYKEAYIIQGGKTVLGDGGGVCQVSTTLFRAILNSGLPITERRPHAYRVSYYESQSPPGLDATVYYPTVDLKFKNDTGNYILIQSYIDLENQSLRYVLYGKKDGREVELTTPVVTNVIPAPEPLNQDDPNLPKGTVKQIDFAAAGATVVFGRTVKKDGKVIIDEKYTSRYSPWRAVYLVGTKEG